MSWFDIVSSLLDERTVIETSAIAVGSSFTALFYFLFRRTETHAKRVKSAVDLDVDADLEQKLQDVPSSRLPYVAVTGYVSTSEKPLLCKFDDRIKGVIWSKSTTEHKDVYHGFTQSWRSTTNEISSVSDSIPFALKGQNNPLQVTVVSPLESSWIEDSIEVVHEEFTPVTSNVMDNIVGFISGDRVKGYTNTERMLRLGTKLCVIGDLAREGDVIQVRPPQISPGEYIISKLSKNEIASGIKRKATLWKVLAILFAAASITGIYFFVRRLQKRLKEIKQERTSNEQLNQIRHQRTAITARLNRGSEDRSSEQSCVICLINPRECVLLDCGHICICVDCLEALPSPKECPMCRSKVVRTVPLYHA